jgi:hypothetical protein
MKTIKNILMLTVMLVSFNLSNAQIKNENTDSEKISGNCGMCKKTIKKTNKDEILKRIALAGYDSESFLAPDEAYNNLPGCCQYNRENKTATIMKPEMKMEMKEKMKMKSSESAKPLALIYNTYFKLKDALVASDSKVVSEKANDLLASIEKVDMKSLKMDVHMVWMKNLKPIKEEVKIIVSAKNIEQQREQFIGLSDNMYKVMKIEKSETPIYHQHCPMANDGKGANWLSKEEKVKKPYYGSKMLSCGKIVETIQ